MNLPATHKHTTPIFKKGQPDDSYKFKPLPAPTGSYPYHLSLEPILPKTGNDKLVFHMVGDTGGMRKPDFQRLVADAMAKQYLVDDPADQPRFLYHLGDVVYHFGEAEYYPQQFFTPYKNYPGPIFAIAGNHDADVNSENPVPYQSLDAFTSVFCAPDNRDSKFIEPSGKRCVHQPNIYWTLETPLANIIGLYSNVPKYGVITDEQKSWFIAELGSANAQKPDKALIVCVHHSPYSADFNHGSSQPMIEFLEQAFEETGIKPDIIFSGHVHNYQRFNKHYPDGHQLPFVVSGAGGFDELHSLALQNDSRYTNESPLFNHVQLEKYCDDKHGFLKITLEKVAGGLQLTGEYYTIPHTDTLGKEVVPTLFDRFVYSIHQPLES